MPPHPPLALTRTAVVEGEGNVLIGVATGKRDGKKWDKSRENSMEKERVVVAAGRWGQGGGFSFSCFLKMRRIPSSPSCRPEGSG